jgi:hypothetical protein
VGYGDEAPPIFVERGCSMPMIERRMDRISEGYVSISREEVLGEERV